MLIIIRGKCGTRWADNGSTSKINKFYDDVFFDYSHYEQDESINRKSKTEKEPIIRTVTLIHLR